MGFFRETYQLIKRGYSEPHISSDAPVDQQFEFQHGGNFHPRWYAKLIKAKLIILLVAIIAIPLAMRVAWGTSQGSEIFILIIFGLVLLITLPFRIFAYFQRKLEFRGSLSPELKSAYDATHKKRVTDFLRVVIISLIVLAIFVPLLLYIDSVRNG